jgi:protoporphyrinogen oxidase
MSKKTAIIIGAGPAGLTAAYELLDKTDITPIVIEASDDIGGISKTVNYKGNRIDIGGHRFFSKSDRVMDWWLNILPVDETIKEKNDISSSSSENEKIMLVRDRLSRIYFLRKFFNYPVSLNFQTIKNLGLIRLIKIFFSYLYIRIFPIKKEKSLEHFFINRFGKSLYNTFFKNYTEKVWGIPCSEISAEWGAQRIKGLSISKAFIYAVKRIFSSNTSIRQKEIETSLIEKFLYPKYGPGQLWEEVAKIIENKGGKVLKNTKAIDIIYENNQIIKLVAQEGLSNNKTEFSADYFISSMPVKDLINGFSPAVPRDISKIANGLVYRDFITVGLLLDKLKIKNKNTQIKDNWIYIQESDVKVGRLQIFNNWSPFMVNDPNKVWIGLEYFCYESDELWQMNDKDFGKFAIDELDKIEIINKEDVLDNVVIRVPKTYPAYFGTYSEFNKIKEFTNTFENLFLIGRNGMHKYNNQDHSMLTAMIAVENIIENIKTKDNIWSVNTEEEYHEEKV